jgi:hypothetical protein
LRERRERREKEGKGGKRRERREKEGKGGKREEKEGKEGKVGGKSRRDKEEKERKTYQLHFPTNSCNKQDFPNPGWEVMTTVFTISVFISGDLSTKVFFWEMDIWPGSVQSAGGGEMDITCSRARRRARISLSRPTRFLVGLRVRRREQEEGEKRKRRKKGRRAERRRKKMGEGDEGGEKGGGRKEGKEDTYFPFLNFFSETTSSPSTGSYIFIGFCFPFTIIGDNGINLICS